MIDRPHEDPEQALRAAWALGDFDRVARMTLRMYGHEILSFVAGRLRSSADGEEAFAIFAEDFWIGLPGFSWRCSMKGWAYTLARNAASRYARAVENHPHKRVPLSQLPMSQLVASVRATGDTNDRTDLGTRIRQLRNALPLEDQTLLTLTVDRRLPWREIAMVMSDDGPLDDEALVKEAARLRKRFQRLKADLKVQARKAGLSW